MKLAETATLPTLGPNKKTEKPYYITTSGLVANINDKPAELPMGTTVVLIDFGANDEQHWIKGTTPEGHKFQIQINTATIATHLAPDLRTGQGIPGPVRQSELTSHNPRFRHTDTTNNKAFLIAGSIGQALATAVSQASTPEKALAALSTKLRRFVDRLFLNEL